MRLLFLVNRIDELQPRMTTSMLIEAAARHGLETWVCEIGSPWLDSEGRWQALARRPGTAPAARGDEANRARWLAELAGAAPRPFVLGEADRLWIRTNPARDPGRSELHRLALELATLASEQGWVVLNEPGGLSLASSKLYLARLPRSTVPRSLVAAEASVLRGFVEATAGPVVLKPLSGSRGLGVFRVAAGEPNLPAILELLLARGPVLAQDWVPGAEAGDLRVLLLDGEPLRTAGGWAAIHRRPAAGDFRSNLHAGGRAEPAEPSATQQATLAAIAPRLVADGLRLVGVDLIGDRVIELNVFSPGGLRDAERFAGVDFASLVVRSLCADGALPAGPAGPPPETPRR